MNDDLPVSEIPRVPVDAEAVRGFTREREHFHVAFNLLREVVQWAVLLGSAVTGTVRDWTLEEAVFGGQFVRLSKLLRAFLEQAKDNRAELAWVSSRLITECVVNVSYLLANRSEDLLKSYLHQSLQHERDLLKTIRTNIKGRSGQELPIETRMIRSIERTFRNSEIRLDDLPDKKVHHWGGKTLRQKAEALGMLTVYQTAIAGSSRNVHGSWYDLLQHHLEVVPPGRFRPRFEETRVRPQLLYALAVLTLEAYDGYIQHLGTSKTEGLHKRIVELDERVRLANDLHEQFLVERGS
ncbi:MAG: DUF5677 domain-containing protein [Gemmatimonadaceae bacterium]|nr:DUF5677 domain-containing protein [Gemmatimonadaceae bacterium]